MPGVSDRRSVLPAYNFRQRCSKNLVEAVLVEQFVEPGVDGVRRALGRLADGDPKILPALPPFTLSHRHKTIISPNVLRATFNTGC